MTEFDVYTYGVPIVLLLITAEVIYSSAKRLKFYKLEDTFAGLGLLLGNFLIGLLTKSSIFLIYVYLYQFRLITVNDLLPIWIVWLATFIMIDFVYYLVVSNYSNQLFFNQITYYLPKSIVK